MKHYDEDTFLRRALGLLDLEEKERLDAHLNECEACQRRYGDLQVQVAAMGSVQVEAAGDAPPLPKAKFVSLKSLLRSAAILILGFAVGYLTSEILRAPTIQVVPQRFACLEAPPPVGSAISCEAIDINP